MKTTAMAVRKMDLKREGQGIMRTCILLAGVLGIFFVPSPAPAQCGPDDEGGCTECGPYYGSWSLDWCPYLNNSPGINPTSFNQCPGDSPQKPSVTAPTYGVGQKERPVSYDCSDPTTDYAGITYTVSAVQWDPPLPSKFAQSNCPTFASTAYVSVTSSDTSLCPSPGRVDIGSCTWNVTCGCIASTYSTNCTDGSVTLTNVTVNPTNGCLGTSFTASAQQIISNAIVVITTHYKNACGQTTTNCPDTCTTNSTSPTIVSNWWVVTGVGATPQSGSGTSASFTATNAGNGTVTFYTKWQHVCDTSTSTVSASGNFTVQCPNQAITASNALCSNTYGATFTYCYDCANAWYIKETVTQLGTTNCDPVPIQASTNAFQMNGNCVSDQIYDFNGPPANVADCTDTTAQTIQMGPTANNLCCSFNNTQVITVTRTNGTNTPPHGTVVTSSGGVSTSCNW